MIHMKIELHTDVPPAGVLTKSPSFEVVCVSTTAPIVKLATGTQSGVEVPSRTDPFAVSGSWWEMAWVSYRAYR